ncbi:tRNA lysidine(34) synthetase TilS [Candidatus Pelagibacter sp.]|nr:tRNA lysidine(34) synthetase TilS [Candidatus Pelagibacter sp.]
MKKKSSSVKRKNLKNLTFITQTKNKKIKKIYERFEFLINQKEFKGYLVAVSGGADSLALAYLSKCYQIKNKNKNFHYIHVDHKLRNTSSNEAQTLKKVLKKFKIECRIITRKKKKNTKKTQSASRNFRFKVFENFCKTKKINTLLLGHHLDDFQENFFIRLLRGSGLKGLVSFYNYRNLQRNNINIVRPLLDFSKEDLLYVTKNTFNFHIDDPSNRNLEYLRSRVRFMINNLKKNGLDQKKFKKTFENLISSNSSIEFFVQKNISENSYISLSKNNNNKAILSSKFFSSTDEIILRSFTKILQDISGRYFPARGKGVSRIINQIKQKFLTKTTIGGCVIEKIENSVVISKENTK